MHVPTVAVADTGTTAEDVAVTFTQADLKGNDTDVDNSNAQLSVTAVSNPLNGAVVLNGNGTVTFTPAPDFNGTAGFDYTVSDGSLSDIGHVTITVTPVNDAPLAVDDSATTPEDVAVTIAPLANDSDPDGDPLIITGATATNGTVVIVGATNLVFTPATNFNGTATIIYTISDGKGGSASATVTTTVTPDRKRVV